MDSPRKRPRQPAQSPRAEYLSTSAIIDAFSAKIAAAGIVTSDTIEPDGILHRVHVEGHRQGTKNAAYILHGDCHPVGWYLNFSTGVSGTWTPGGGKWHMDAATRQAIEKAKAQRKAEQNAKYERIAVKACDLWQSAVRCIGYPYLQRKHVTSHGLRIGTWRKWIPDDSGWRKLEIPNTLLVPMMGDDGRLWNLQAIFAERHAELGRDKDFLPGRKSGLFYAIGDPTQTIMVCEGYATGATIYEMTGKQTVIAFDASNLKSVAQIVRQAHPDATIILCADNDRFTPGNPGVTKAREAALAVGGKVSIPAFPEGVAGSDWNDLMMLKEEAHV